MSPATVVTIACLLSSVLASQQPAENWTLRQPYAAYDFGVAIHPGSGRPVVYGGSHAQTLDIMPHLWEWSGNSWLRHVGAPDPGLQVQPIMATDVQRGQIVLCGSSGQQDVTWTWDGVDWRTHAGVPHVAGAMAFDSVRGRMVLFTNLSYASNGLYEWDGNTWTPRYPVGSAPSARLWPAMAFDAARGRMVLFGGGYGQGLNDTWEWDGTSWTHMFPSLSPPPRTGHAMGYDPVRQRVVLFGGIGAASPVFLTDTWEWNGANWVTVTTAHSPASLTNVSQRLPPLVFDRTRSRLTLLPAEVTGAVWEYDGVDWSLVTSASAPSGRRGAAVVDDPARGALVMFGGLGYLGSAVDFLGDTWTWDGRRWAIAATATSPSPRTGHAMAHDPARGVVTLFGGMGSTAVMRDDTWTWTGSWTLLQPTNRPPPRAYPGFAWHAPSQRVVLFGGVNAPNLPLSDTWTWDGSNWRQENPATSPSARNGPCMTGTGQNVVLFGGVTGQVPLVDTWTWDGSNWTQLQPPVSPPATFYPACTWDSDRGRVVLLGGLPSSYQTSMDSWTFDGVTWTPLVTAIAPAVRTNHMAAYDPRRHELLMFGGVENNIPHGSFPNDTWTLAVAARQDTFGAGCPGSLGVPALQAGTGTIPEPGGVVSVDVVNLPMSVAMMAGGFSRTMAGSQPLPMSLASFGMPGCNLLVSPDATVLLVGSGNAARWSMSLPSVPGLLGIEFYLQAFAWDPAANAAGVTASNGGRCRVGN
jgi:hypothetical protein